jgi:hypothetical protein
MESGLRPYEKLERALSISAPRMSIMPDVVDAQLRLQFLGRDVMLPSVMASDSDPASAHDPNAPPVEALKKKGPQACVTGPCGTRTRIMMPPTAAAAAAANVKTGRQGAKYLQCAYLLVPEFEAGLCSAP